MEKTSEPSRRKLFIGLGAAVGLIFVIALITYALFGSTKRDNTDSVSDTSGRQVATQEEVRTDLDGATDAIKRSADDQTIIRAAMEDKNRVEVGTE